MLRGVKPAIPHREDDRMAKKKPANRIVFTIGMVLCVIFAVMLVGNLTIIIKGIIHP